MSGRVIKLVLEYDGTTLCGWQRQLNGPSVQQHLEEALEKMVGAPVQVTGAGRTDSGVHALGQVASFRTTSSIPPEGFRLGLNGLLPESIAVVGASHESDDFSARFSASGKHYRYAVFTRSSRSALLARRAWHRPGPPLDRHKMREAIPHLIGEKDWSAFRAAGCSAKTPHRRIDQVTLSEPTPDHLQIDVWGNAFLRNMVRILAGTLVAVGEGRIAPAQLPEIVASRDRTRAGMTAPPHGLTLVEVMYAPKRRQVSTKSVDKV